MKICGILSMQALADILNVTLAYLLQHQLIDQYDLVELVDKKPELIANSIKTNPRMITLQWEKVSILL